MKTLTTITAVITLGLSLIVSSVASAATLIVPSQLEVQSNKVSMNFQQQKMELKTGKHLLEVIYRDMFDYNADDSGVWIRSEPLYVALNITHDGEYRLQLPSIKSKKQAKEFIESPKIELISENEKAEPIVLLTHQQLMAKLWNAQ